VDEVLAQLSSPLVQMLIDYNVESRLSAGRSQRIAAECAAVISRSEYVHHGSIGKHRRYGIDPASKRLAEYQNIRLYPFILECKHFACASESGLYLVKHQQHVAFGADASHRFQKSVGGH